MSSKLADEIRAILKNPHGIGGGEAGVGWHRAIQAASELVEKREAERVLVWTKTLPAVEGWYWVRMVGEKCRPAIQDIYPCKDHLSCRGEPITSFVNVEWAGPINLPESEVL